VVAQFVQADISQKAIIFVKNATEAINKLANRITADRDQFVLVSKMEHHSNDLPWRKAAKVIHIAVLPDGRLDEEDLLQKLKKYRGRIALVALTGASNVTGWVNDINHLAALSHEYGSRILIDAAQLAPHRSINMMRKNDPGHIDFLVFSAHKIYAPFGAGVLIGDKEFFDKSDPDYVGGGTVSIVGFDYAHWNESPERDEAGSPNTIGVIALAKSLICLQQLQMSKLAQHEKILTRYLLTKMIQIPNVEIYGGTDPSAVDDRLGVISFNVHEMPHALTAAILNHEGGIGVRNGCFCAHPYIKILMGISEGESKILEQQILRGDRSSIPGAVRASFGMYNSAEEIDYFVDILERVATGKYHGKYVLNKNTGEYFPEGYDPNYFDYFDLKR
jgi:selenocysteine lyase/cysteine desulfurase